MAHVAHIVPRGSDRANELDRAKNDHKQAHRDSDWQWEQVDLAVRHDYSAREQDAVKSAQQFLNLETVRYQTGVDPYIDVLTAQNTLLSDQQTAATLQIQQMVASVELIEALGGGWDRSQLPTPAQVSKKVSNADYKIQQ